MTWCGILENLISDFILAAIIIIGSWLWIYFTYRRSLQDFFNVSKTKRLVIYLSNITVLAFGSIGITGKKLSYMGDTVAYGEMQFASQIRNLFSFIIPRLAEASKTIGKLLLSDVDVQIIKSPKDINKLDTQASLISLGSPAYNAGSLYIEKTGKSNAKFIFGEMKASDLQVIKGIPPTVKSSTDNNIYDPTTGGPISTGLPEMTQSPGDTGVAFVSTMGTASLIPPSGESFPTDSSIIPDPRLRINIPIEPAQEKPKISEDNEQSSIVIEGMPPFTDTTYGFIERLKDPDSDRFLFYVAGLSEFATKGAANYLATHWRSLYKKYNNDRPFLIMLSFNISDINKWSLIFEKA